jgi:hypothetical protein
MPVISAISLYDIPSISRRISTARKFDGSSSSAFRTGVPLSLWSTASSGLGARVSGGKGSRQIPRPLAATGLYATRYSKYYGQFSGAKHGGWRALPHHTAVQSRRGFLLRVAHFFCGLCRKGAGFDVALLNLHLELLRLARSHKWNRTLLSSIMLTASKSLKFAESRASVARD